MKFTKITISGKICTGKTSLFKNLLKELKWPSFSTSQYFRKLAKAKSLSLETADEQNEKTTKEVDYKVRDLLKAQGNLIVEGWMTGIMANDFPGILKVLLVSSDQTRVVRFSKREKIPLQEAKKRIEEREANLFNKLKQIYKRNDFLAKENYNSIIDTSNLLPNEVFNKVLKALN